MSNNENTKSVRTQTRRSSFKEHSTPLYLTSSFLFDDAEDMRAVFADEKQGYIYSRYTNPTTDEFVTKVCLLEGAEAGVATGSGMAAIYSTFMALLKSGDHIISCSSVFGATHTILTKYFPRIGISHSYFDVREPEKIKSLIKPETKIIYAETPTNPGVEVLDLELLGKIANENNLILIIDNCFATPILQKPLEFGAHLSIHSATKYFDGQGRVIGGVVVGRKDLIQEVYLFARISGPSLSPFNAWILTKSLETLSLRMERHCSNALYVAQALEKHPKVESVRYPFLPSHPQFSIAKKQMKAGGGIVSFLLKGGINSGRIFLNELKMLSLSANLGDSRSIATHPASTTHAKLSEDERQQSGIQAGLIRVSVGLEDKEDILNDILQAIEKA
jgi:O-succinylhomoserine sulfhydrylase